jgi:hypothetical protein
MTRFPALVLLAVFPAGVAIAQSGYGKSVTFSGLHWLAKVSSAKVGPGPNFFSQDNVSVDAQGRLHLKITKSAGKWQCSEVVLQEILGYGTYRFYVDSTLDNLDPSVVLGLFTWNDDPAYNHRELDIEFARWGSAANKNGWYTVQPYNVAGNQASFIQPSTTAGSTHILDWLRDPASGSLSASFSSLFGFAIAPSPSNQLIYQNTFSNGVPPTGGENVRMNLWLFQGRAPAGRNSVEIIVNKFEFVPE